MSNSNVEYTNKTFNEIQLIQRSPEWKEFRKGKIGASQVAAILGLNPFQTKLQVWEEIALGTEKSSNEAMQRGIRLEPEALRWFNIGYAGNGPIFRPTVVQSVQFPDLIASLDGWNGTKLVEIKCPKKFSETIPGHYFPQLQHQMFITNTKSCWYIEFDGRDGNVHVCERDEDFIHEMLVAEFSFLASIIDFRPPEPSDMDWATESDPELTMKAERYKELSLLMDELEVERESIRKMLTTEFKYPRIRCADLKIQKVISKGLVNYKAIKELESVDLEQYRGKPRESWRITL